VGLEVKFVFIVALTCAYGMDEYFGIVWDGVQSIDRLALLHCMMVFSSASYVPLPAWCTMGNCILVSFQHLIFHERRNVY